MQKTKRVRTAFSPAQLIQLENAFKLNHYVIGNERKHLAKKLQLSETQVFFLIKIFLFVFFIIQFLYLIKSAFL